MNTKGKSFKKSYIILLIILIIALISMFVLLEFAKNERKSKPLVNNNTTNKLVTTTSTTSIDINESFETPKVENKDNNQIVINATNFSASLEEIIDGNTFYYDYKVSIMYNGAKFDFNCTKYDEINSICLEGSGLMNTGEALIPLYTYSNESENYLLHQEDYYIMINDDYIILTSNYVGKSSGNIKIYKKNGDFYSKTDNVLTGYRSGERLIKRLYPNINSNFIYYYMCSENNVKVSSFELENVNNISVIENIDNVTCY